MLLLAPTLVALVVEFVLGEWLPPADLGPVLARPRPAGPRVVRAAAAAGVAPLAAAARPAPGHHAPAVRPRVEAVLGGVEAEGGGGHGAAVGGAQLRDGDGGELVRARRLGRLQLQLREGRERDEGVEAGGGVRRVRGVEVVRGQRERRGVAQLVRAARAGHRLLPELLLDGDVGVRGPARVQHRHCGDTGLALGWHWAGTGLALGWHWAGLGWASGACPHCGRAACCLSLLSPHSGLPPRCCCVRRSRLWRGLEVWRTGGLGCVLAGAGVGAD